MPSKTWPSEWIVPAWSAHPHIHAVVTTRSGAGESLGAFGAINGGAGLNLGMGSGDDRTIVARNRATLAGLIGITPFWLSQVHGATVVKADHASSAIMADASWTNEPGIALAVLVADCLPVLFADRLGRVVAAAHAGWRGLASGVLEATLAALPVAASDMVAFLGPSIGASRFQVGADVFDAFTNADRHAREHFVAEQEGKWLCDLHGLARQRLLALGVEVVGAPLCTFELSQQFYSYRRDKVTGRMAALVWLSQGA